MKIVIFGATDLSLSIANFLHQHSYDIVAIVTTKQTFKINYKPDGVTNTRFVDFNAWGLEKKVPVILHESTEQTMVALQNLKADFAIVAGWYHMINKQMRALFPQGCAGFHASLLPQLRGGAPLNWALLLGLNETGVSFFELSDGVDDGLLYAQETFSINSEDYIADLLHKTEELVIKILADKLLLIQNGTIETYTQHGIASYAGQRVPEDSKIDWSNSAEKIIRLIKASSKPYPGAYCYFENEMIHVWRAAVSDLQVYGTPGQIMVINGLVHVVCGVSAIVLQEVSANYMRFLITCNNKRMSNG